jgi:hypothetical protein
VVTLKNEKEVEENVKIVGGGWNWLRIVFSGCLWCLGWRTFRFYNQSVSYYCILNFLVFLIELRYK